MRPSRISEIPIVKSSSDTGDVVLLRSGRTRKRSTSSPVTSPTATLATNATHQFQPQSSTHFASSSADSVPSCAWARLRKRLDL